MAEADQEVLAQLTELPLKISRSECEGKTYIVTGANGGLGLEAARHLTAAGAAKVVLTSRKPEAGVAAVKDIEDSTGIKGVAENWDLDLSSFKSVQAFADKAINELDHIDAIIENAGMAGGPPFKVEGHLPQLTVNVISTFLLAILLLPKLRADAVRLGHVPRISIVTSNTCLYVGDFWKTVVDSPIEKMDEDAKIGPIVYPASKAMVTMAVLEIASKLPVSDGHFILNCIHPGLCVTNLAKEAPPDVQKSISDMWEKAGRSAECGSRTLLAGAVADESSHGTYMNDCEPANSKIPSWMDDNARKANWVAISNELEKIVPGCVDKAFA